jgi:hypothetical protein
MVKNNNNESSKILKRWLSPRELELEYGFSLSAQAKMRMIKNHVSIPYSKVGGYVRYDRFEIDKWLENHQIQFLSN